MKDKINLKDLSFSRQEELMVDLGEKPYRARQIRPWLYKKECCSIDGMTDLSKPLREKLSQNYCADGLKTLAREKSADGTVKYLFELKDGLTIETVYIPEEKRRTVCLSTQVGCKFGCAFCATGKQGFSRSLTVGEILNQIVEVQKDSEAGSVTNIVLMGMGEPLDNFDAVTEALKIINSPEGFSIGERKITLSTVGLTSKIKRLGELGLNVNLAISLHAADDAVRENIMPVARKFPVAGLMEACSKYPLKPRREISFEVILFSGINDRPSDVKKLIKALHGVRAKVNLLVFNQVANAKLRPSSDENVRYFRDRLRASRITATIRNSRGGDINAACGQLKSFHT